MQYAWTSKEAVESMRKHNRRVSWVLTESGKVEPALLVKKRKEAKSSEVWKDSEALGPVVVDLGVSELNSPPVLNDQLLSIILKVWVVSKTRFPFQSFKLIDPNSADLNGLNIRISEATKKVVLSANSKEIVVPIARINKIAITYINWVSKHPDASEFHFGKTSTSAEILKLVSGIKTAQNSILALCAIVSVTIVQAFFVADYDVSASIISSILTYGGLNGAAGWHYDRL